MYSPADRPSSNRAAPAKNRIWSTDGTSSSDAVSPRGLPVLRHSASTRSAALASTASAIRSSARWRSDGVLSRQASNPASAADIAASTSELPETGVAAKTSPVDGSIRSAYPPSAGSTYSPLMKLRSTVLSVTSSPAVAARWASQRIRCLLAILATEFAADKPLSHAFRRRGSLWRSGGGVLAGQFGDLHEAYPSLPAQPCVDAFETGLGDHVAVVVNDERQSTR